MISPCQTGHVTPDAIRDQLERILASPQFAGSARMSRFLRFVVERSLAGEGERLKEYVIGIEVFDRGNGYDPRVDSIVRVEAGRLRGKLDEYYHGMGNGDAVRIRLKKGGYAPFFEQRQNPVTAAGTHVRRRRGGVAVMTGAAVILLAVAAVWRIDRSDPVAAGPALAVLPFVPYGGDTSADVLGERLTEGVTAELVRDGRVGVVPSARSARFRDPRAIPSDVAQQLGAQLLLLGRLTMIEADQLRVNVVLIDDSRNRKAWVSSFTGARQNLDELERRIAQAVSEAIASMPVAAQH